LPSAPGTLCNWQSRVTEKAAVGKDGIATNEATHFGPSNSGSSLFIR